MVRWTWLIKERDKLCTEQKAARQKRCNKRRGNSWRTYAYASTSRTSISGTEIIIFALRLQLTWQFTGIIAKPVTVDSDISLRPWTLRFTIFGEASITTSPMAFYPCTYFSRDCTRQIVSFWVCVSRRSSLFTMPVLHDRRQYIIFVVFKFSFPTTTHTPAPHILPYTTYYNFGWHRVVSTSGRYCFIITFFCSLIFFCISWVTRAHSKIFVFFYVLHNSFIRHYCLYIRYHNYVRYYSLFLCSGSDCRTLRLPHAYSTSMLQTFGSSSDYRNV